MVSSTFILQAVAALATVASAVPYRMGPRVIVPQEYYEVLNARANAEVNMAAVTDVTCFDPKQNIVNHDENVAQLGICGGIAGTTKKCRMSPIVTTGEAGTARFTLRATEPGATINIDKDQWEQCVRAARAVCPTGSMGGTCVGGATIGNLVFRLENP